jgi:ArsR family transcriptional regulator
LRNKNIVVGVKNGKNVMYTLRDPAITELLGVAQAIFNNHLIDTYSMLEELDNEEKKG